MPLEGCICDAAPGCGANTHTIAWKLSHPINAYPTSVLKGAEVRVGGNYDPPFALGALEDQFVISSLHPVITHVRNIMPSLPQSVRKDGRKRIIDEKSQEAERSGSSRSSTASAA
jgi:hypothetical protein